MGRNVHRGGGGTWPGLLANKKTAVYLSINTPLGKLFYNAEHGFEGKGEK